MNFIENISGRVAVPIDLSISLFNQPLFHQHKVDSSIRTGMRLA
jgi:hypothetical protein